MRRILLLDRALKKGDWRRVELPLLSGGFSAAAHIDSRFARQLRSAALPLSPLLSLSRPRDVIHNLRSFLAPLLARSLACFTRV